MRKETGGKGREEGLGVRNRRKGMVRKIREERDRRKEIGGEE